MRYKNRKDVYEEHCGFVNEADCEEELDDADVNIGNDEYWEDE